MPTQVLYLRVDEKVHRWVQDVARSSHLPLGKTAELMFRALMDQGLSRIEVTPLMTMGAAGDAPSSAGAPRE